MLCPWCHDLQLGAVVCDDPFEHLREVEGRPVADHLLNFGDVGETARHVLKPFRVSLLVGHEDDLRSTPRFRLDH